MSITSFMISHHKLCGNGGALAINDNSAMEKPNFQILGKSSSLFDERSEEIENRFNIDLDGIDYDAKFVFETVGYNLEGNELGAALGLHSQKLQHNIKTRQLNFKKQCDFFSSHSEYFINPIETSSANTAWLAFPILIKDGSGFSKKNFKYIWKKGIFKPELFLQET